MTTTRAETSTTTFSVSATDVRQIMRDITGDIQAVCRAAAHALCFDTDAALVDASILILNAVASGIILRIHLNNVVVREYRFLLTESRNAASGPPSGKPPLGYVPDGARLRLSVILDERTPAAERQAWLDRLGWTTEDPLEYALGTAETTYGAFRSGGLYVQRQLRTNPKYDKGL